MHIIAIDGPVGSGKSTIARLLAKRLGYACLDTGAMYRAIGWKAYTTGVDLNEADLERLCANTELDIELINGQQRVVVDGKDVTAEIRTPEISRMSSAVSRFISVRKYLVRLQRETGLEWAGQYRGIIAEGRDMGTVVFPDATVKFYLDADMKERGRRRWEELRDKGLEVDLEDTIDGIRKRDESDQGRSVDPLRKAEDAIVIDTTGLTLEGVMGKMLGVINQFDL